MLERKQRPIENKIGGYEPRKKGSRDEMYKSEIRVQAGSLRIGTEWQGVGAPECLVIT